MKVADYSMQRNTHSTLIAIQTAADFIAGDTAGMTFDGFLENRLVRQAVERNFEIIGEAVGRLRTHDPAIASQISAPRQIVDFRNAIAHGYDRIDHPTVWKAIQTSLPVLRAEVEAILGQSDAST
jgi:uncharacterized protein with HEPN domain